jgi:hypothetical protein
MEIIIHLDDQLYRLAQEHAQVAGQTLETFISQTLNESLEKQFPSPSKEKTPLIQNFQMRLRPGIDISNSAELLDIMEEGLDISKRR